MKWPNTLTIVRHGESAYNILKSQKDADPQYAEFKKAYNRKHKDPQLAKELAQLILKSGKYSVDKGDHATPLTEYGHEQAQTTGRELPTLIEKPDIILYSPYVRTKQTLADMTIGWPELGLVDSKEEERLREQEHGLSTLYGDWRIFNILHPDQDLLRRREGSYWYRYPQGESVPDVRERTRSLAGTIIRDYAGMNVMWVTHHLTILSVRANQERFGAEEFIRLDQEEKPVNCGVTIYRGEPDQGRNGKLALDQYNVKLY